MNAYDPQKVFSNLYKTPFGKKLWKLLNSSDIIPRLEAASDLKKPAVEAIQRQLLKEFGEKFKEDDQKKKMTGHMVRQILESRNYNHERHGVKVITGNLFSVASRYKRNDVD